MVQQMTVWCSAPLKVSPCDLTPLPGHGKERLGHSTISITLDTYSHVAPGLQEAAANRFDEAFKASSKESVRK